MPCMDVFRYRILYCLFDILDSNKTHAHKHTRTHTPTHIHTHSHTHTYTHTHMHTHKYKYTHVDLMAYMWTICLSTFVFYLHVLCIKHYLTNEQTNKLPQAHMHTQSHTQTYANICILSEANSYLNIMRIIIYTSSCLYL